MQLRWLNSIFPFCFLIRLWQGVKMKRKVSLDSGLQHMLTWCERDVNQSNIVMPTNSESPQGHMLTNVTPAVTVSLFPLSLHLCFLYRSQIQSCKARPPPCSVLMSLIWRAYILNDFLLTSFPFTLDRCLSLFIFCLYFLRFPIISFSIQDCCDKTLSLPCWSYVHP